MATKVMKPLKNIVCEALFYPILVDEVI